MNWKILLKSYGNPPPLKDNEKLPKPQNKKKRTLNSFKNWYLPKGNIEIPNIFCSI